MISGRFVVVVVSCVCRLVVASASDGGVCRLVVAVVASGEQLVAASNKQLVV
jgi:hypothetical protein